MELVDLPDDILIYLTESLSTLNIIRYSQVSKRIHNLCQQSCIWKRLLMKNFH